MAWIDALFNRMVEVGASDLHMTSGVKPQFRLHGDIVPIDECAEIQPDQMSQILKEISPSKNWTQFEDECDTDFAYYLPGVARFRVNLFMDNRGPGAVFRVIPEDILTCDQLGLPQSVRDLCFLSKGLVVVTGPTGSGKSTTLAAMVDHINKNRSDHILTIEDPIEFVHKDRRCLINQRQVGGHTSSFKRALKAALREDPDIVLVGEMRDLETISIAIETAETGHLVFGTLHTTTAAEHRRPHHRSVPAPSRQEQIRVMLSVVVARVSSRRCSARRRAAVVAAALRGFDRQLAPSRTLIREGKTHQITSSMQMGGKAGMRLLNDSLTEIVASGQVAPDEAYIKAVDKDGFISALRAAGVNWSPEMIGQGQGAASPGAAQAAPAPAPSPQPQPSAQQPEAPLPSAQSDEPPPSPVADPFEQFKKQRG